MPILTLLYHRVNNLIKDHFLLAVSPENFREHMIFLKENYKIVRFDEDWSKIQQEKAVCITFDDGYMDNFEIALPILNELNIPATVFVSSGTLTKAENLWWDELERVIFDSTPYSEQFELKDELFAYKFNTSSFEARQDFLENIHWIMKNYISVEKRNLWIKQLQKWHEPMDSPDYRTVRKNEKSFVLMNSKNLTIGAHTVNHPMLSRLSIEEQRSEIRESKLVLEKFLGKDIKVFSYPFGGKCDYNSDSIEICKELGFQRVASNFPGIWNSEKDNYEVPRNIVRNWTRKEFAENVINMWV